MKNSLFLLSLAAASALPACAQNQNEALKTPIQWPVRSNDAAPAGAEIAEQAPRAMAILNAWENAAPQKADRILRIVYWTPKGRAPAPRYRERLSQIMLDIQAFYRREMARNGLGPRTFKLPVEADGQLQIVVATGDKTREFYSGDTGTEIRNDGVQALKKIGIDANKETILIFCNLADWDAAKRTVTGSSPYYGGGSTRQGTAWQSDSPVLDITQLTNEIEADKVSGQYGNTTLARYNSIFIGGIAHELGHALSMPHSLERPDQANWGKSLMGSGNRTYGEALLGNPKSESKGHGSFLLFANALRLASHPSFSGSVKGFDAPANAELDSVKIGTTDKSLSFSAHVTSDPPTYGVIGYFDPAGGGDYDATTATAIPDKNGDFTLTTTALTAGKSGQLRVALLQANGTTMETSYPFDVRADGTVDLTQWNTAQQLLPLAAAINTGDRKAVQAALDALETQKAPENLLEIARVQLANFDKIAPPTPASATGKTLWLSEAKPASEQVGYLRPAYNSLPVEGKDVGPLMSSGGQYYARWIYAHAPASHVYDLNGQWTGLRGLTGAPIGRSLSVAFVIVGDGKELWRHAVTDQSPPAPFDVDVSGVKKLELRVEDGGNGNGSDWAIWLDPQLSR